MLSKSYWPFFLFMGFKNDNSLGKDSRTNLFYQFYSIANKIHQLSVCNTELLNEDIQCWDSENVPSLLSYYPKFCWGGKCHIETWHLFFMHIMQVKHINKYNCAAMDTIVTFVTHLCKCFWI